MGYGILNGKELVRAQTDASGQTVLEGAGGVPFDKFPHPINPNGLSWLTDTISGFDIYERGFVKRPTIFFDPTATSSLNRGTLAQPYNTQAALQLAVAGNMAGHVLGIKRGTTLRTTGTNGLVFTAYGASGSPLILCPYGDAEALPIITGAAIITTWTLVDATNNVWSYAIGATEHDAWQDDVRLWKKTWNTDAVTTLIAEGTSTYNSNTLYIRPYDGENPNLGQMEVSATDYAMFIDPSNNGDVGGHVHLAGIDVRKARNSACRVDFTAGSSTAIAGIEVNGCRFSGGGVDNSVTLGRDGLIIYGQSEAVRLTDSAIRGCDAEDSLNNAFEYSYTDGMIHEFNQDTTHGGNHVELWASNSNALIRYNIGENHSTTGRILTTVHKGGVWITDYTTNNTDGDQTINLNNAVEFNYFHNMEGQGIDVHGGTGNKIRHNTLHQDATYTTNRLINFGTNASANGTIDCEISNNLCLTSRVGSAILMDVVHGVGIVNSVGSTMTSTVTGDNNYYANHTTGAVNPKVRANGTTYQSAGFATYKGVVTTFDANSTFNATTVDGSAYLESDGSPSATFPGVGTGKTSLTSIGNRYLHGEAYPAAPTIGAMV